MERTRDVWLINYLANHPSIRPGISLSDGSVELDATDFVNHPDHIILADRYGVFVFVKMDEGVYDAHVMFLPAGRGPRLVPLFREAIRIMFTDYSAHTITGTAPDCNKQVRTLVDRVGFKPIRRATVLGQPGTFMVLNKD